jgi:hypothetical protein
MVSHDPDGPAATESTAHPVRERCPRHRIRTTGPPARSIKALLPAACSQAKGCPRRKGTTPTVLAPVVGKGHASRATACTKNPKPSKDPLATGLARSTLWDRSGPIAGTPDGGSPRGPLPHPKSNCATRSSPGTQPQPSTPPVQPHPKVLARCSQAAIAWKLPRRRLKAPASTPLSTASSTASPAPPCSHLSFHHYSSHSTA